MPAVWKDMLKWLDKAWADPAFGEAQIVVREFKVGVDGVEVQEGDVGGSGSVEVNAKDAEKVEEDGKRRDAGYMDQMENVKPNAEDQNTAKEEESGVFDDMV
ncbi:hypothetical protein BJY04DRAFT_189769 [Aspergillus karnatakaensis]|uniref:uncharacterized protein n=1 Tax=Aspergillus karnatakaensis TaxID=1810916 RepID=UPI003CCD46F6